MAEVTVGHVKCDRKDDNDEENEDHGQVIILPKNDNRLGIRMYNLGYSSKFYTCSYMWWES